MSSAARRREQVSQSITAPSCLPPSADSWGRNDSVFEREARFVRVCALSLSPPLIVVVASLDRTFSLLIPPYVHPARCFLFASSLPKTCGILPTSRLLIRSSVRQRRDPFLSIFLFLVSRFRDRAVTDPSFPLAVGPLHLDTVLPSSRFSPFPLLCFSRLVVSSPHLSFNYPTMTDELISLVDGCGPDNPHVLTDGKSAGSTTLLTYPWVASPRSLLFGNPITCLHSLWDLLMVVCILYAINVRSSITAYDTSGMIHNHLPTTLCPQSSGDASCPMNCRVLTPRAVCRVSQRGFNRRFIPSRTPCIPVSAGGGQIHTEAEKCPCSVFCRFSDHVQCQSASLPTSPPSTPQSPDCIQFLLVLIPLSPSAVRIDA